MAKTGKKKGPIEFVYGDWCGYGPCVLRTTTAEGIAAEGDDINESATLGDFIKRCRSKPEVYGTGWVDDLVSWVEDSDSNIDDRLDTSYLPHEDFPTDARSAMLDDLPHEVYDAEIGTVHDAMGGIPWYDIADDDIPRIIAVLESLGHTVRHDQSIFDRMTCP